MPQYLVAGYIPDDFDPSAVDEAAGRQIHALNKEMIAAGVRRFACGLGAAKSLRVQSDGGVLISDGPYLEGDPAGNRHDSKPAGAGIADRTAQAD